MLAKSPNDTGNDSGDDTGASAQGDQPEPVRAKKEGSFLFFLVKLAVLVLLFRSFVFSPFTIPSESMLPGLVNGDYLVAAKWPYGYTRDSLPFSPSLILGRILADQPERGDVVIFKHPVDGTDYIKRVIGLPGDSVAMQGGQIVLNGSIVPKVRIADFDLPLSPNTACHPLGERVVLDRGQQACRYQRYRETLPSGRSYQVLDFGQTFQDDFPPVIVPEGKLFVMGDNRDNSQDSRFPATPQGGVGLVDQNLLIGRASMILWSSDGSVEWEKPWTWFSAARWDRIGNGL